MPPSAVELNGVADMTYIAMGNLLPMPWVPFDGQSPAMYNRAFKQGELVTAPPIAAYYMSASMNKYHTTTAKQISRQHRIFVHKILGACKSAWSTWQDLASLVGLQVMGPTCIGTPGCLIGPPLYPLIMMEAPKETPQELKYSKAIAGAFSTSFSMWQVSVTVPGMPLWPPFAAFPGPVAPPMPNIAPLPLEACPAPGQLAMLAPALVLEMMGLLGDPPPQAMWSLQLFSAVAISLSLNFTKWVATSLWPPGKITGGGPIPTFAPPVVPVGPVVGGQAAAPPGGLMTPGAGGIANALAKLAMDAVEDLAEGDSMADITGDMIGDSLDAVFAAVDAKLGGKSLKSAVVGKTKDALVQEGEQAAKHEAREIIEGVATKETKKEAEKALESIGLKEAKSEAEKEFDKKLEDQAAKAGKKKLEQEMKKLEKEEVIDNAKKASEKATEREAKKAAEEKAKKEAEEATEEAAKKKARAEVVDDAAAKVEGKAERATGDVAKKQAKAEAAREAADQADEEAGKAAGDAAVKKSEAAVAGMEKDAATEEAKDASEEAIKSSQEQMDKEFAEEAKDKGKEWVVNDQVEGYGKDVVKDNAKEKTTDALYGDQVSPEDQLVLDRADEEDKAELENQLEEKKKKKEEEAGFLGTKKAAKEKAEGFEAMNPWFEKDSEEPGEPKSEVPEVPGSSDKPGGGKPEE